MTTTTPENTMCSGVRVLPHAINGLLHIPQILVHLIHVLVHLGDPVERRVSIVPTSGSLGFRDFDLCDLLQGQEAPLALRRIRELRKAVHRFLVPAEVPGYLDEPVDQLACSEGHEDQRELGHIRKEHLH